MFYPIIQGSVISGILFLLYIDDIEDELEGPEDEDNSIEQQEENEKKNATMISIFLDDTKTARTVRNQTDQQQQTWKKTHFLHQQVWCQNYFTLKVRKL